jgi:hypothetical protein
LPLGKLLGACRKSLQKLLGKLLGVCKMHLRKLLGAYRKLLGKLLGVCKMHLGKLLKAYRKLLGSCKKGPIEVRISDKLYIIVVDSYIRGE